MDTRTSKAIDTLALLQRENSTLDPNVTLHNIAKGALKLLDAPVAVIYIVGPPATFDKHTPYFYTPIVEGELQQDVYILNPPKPEGIAQRVIEAHLLVVEDLDQHPELQRNFSTTQGIKSFIAVSILLGHQDESRALLYLDFREVRTFTLEERESVLIYAQYASRVLEQAHLERQYRVMAWIDEQVNLSQTDPYELFQSLYTLIDPLFDTKYFCMLAHR